MDQTNKHLSLVELNILPKKIHTCIMEYMYIRAFKLRHPPQFHDAPVFNNTVQCTRISKLEKL